ncbi:MAG: DUF87 domain-containing protein [Paracoccaceae bacterium]
MADSEGSLTQEMDNFEADASHVASKELHKLIDGEHQVGDLLQIDYDEAEVMVHDHFRQRVGGLPLGCFLLATRLKPEQVVDCTQEDTSLILLRVVGKSRLPNATETDFNRFHAGQRASSDAENWDEINKTDQFTLHQLRYSGVRCRVLGTFRMREAARGNWQLSFGSDISNFYSGRGMKVYKPLGSGLMSIVNFATNATDESHSLHGMRAKVGRVRYASSERIVDEDGDAVAVVLDPTDLIARRTALFGMSRTGKSNTTKMIASSIFRLRTHGTDGRIGQLILDVNGEYANENVQDKTSLKNIALATEGAEQGDVVTYGLSKHPNDPDRKIVKINYYGGDPTSLWHDRDDVEDAMHSLLVGKIEVDTLLQGETVKYIKNFRDTSLEVNAAYDKSEATRYRRAIFAYRAALHAAGFEAPSTQAWYIKSLFGKALRDAMTADQNETDYVRAGTLMGKPSVTGDEAVELCQALRKFMQDKDSEYRDFNRQYAEDHDGRSWHDPRLDGLLAIFDYANGVRSFRSLTNQHDPAAVDDYAEEISDDLLAGRLVIYDQSLGDADQNRRAADRIMATLFERQKVAFVNPKKDDYEELIPPDDVIVYAEEAHNLLPAGNNADVKNIWSRAAKEGSKYRIGLVYATQEPSTIQSNILKNTDNWFVAHLNNSDETRELRKYYDFADFETAILRVPDPGFIRMRTLSNPYIVPIQVDKFRVD